MFLQLHRAVCLLFAATAFLWSSASAQSTIAECSLFADGPNATWTHVLTLTTASDAGSADAQSFSINITSLPAEGANYRVFKTTANGSSFFGNPQALSIGENGATIAAVAFDRAVKIQFSSGDIGFDALSINDEAQNDCFPTPDAGTAISACPAQFAAGANANWAHVLTLTTASDAGSSAAQSFSMNVTSLPAGGANYRVYKTTANGSDFFGNPQALSVGPNSATVAGVAFDRTVKIQFSSGDVQFDALTVNGEAASCEEAPAPATAPSDSPADPTADAADVASVFSGSYTSIATNFNPWWWQSGSVDTEFDPGTGNLALHYSNFNYQGTDLTASNLSGMTHVHLDVWVAEANSGRMLKFTPINSGTGAGEVLVEVPLTPGSWNSVDLPKSAFDGMTWDNIVQMKFDGQFNADGSANGDGWDIYLDNIYFYNDGSGTTTELTYVDVTFNVNMSNEDVSADGVFLAGGADFGFPGDNPMTDAGNGIWTITKQVIAPYTGNYTFLNGNCGDWSCKEDISGQDCADGPYSDRLLSNITDNHVVNTCFGECTTDGSCPPPPSVFHDVTFSVNTDNITVGPNGMYVGGGFLGGSDAYALTDNGDNNWSTTVSIAEGSSGHYVFFNSPSHGGDWGTKEDLAGLECGDPANYNDRFMPAVTAPTSVEYCFGTCDAACSPPPPPAETFNVTFRVDMNNFEGDYGVVNINGSFNGWCGGCNPMSDDDQDGVYEVTLPLEAGTIEYKFTLDGWSQQEEFQPGGSCTTTIDGFTNRTLTFDADTDLSAVCYNSCDACQSAPGCTDSGAVNFDSAAQNDDGSCLYAVTFQVDVSQYAGMPDGGTVYTNGTYNGWCGGCNAMTDAGDGLWTGTFNLPAGANEYKFTINGWNDQESFDGSESCTTDPAEFVNRVATITGAATLPVVCWNSCEACPAEGCTDDTACNYSADAGYDDGSCTYAAANYDCAGDCLNDTDGDGICDELEIAGCTDSGACNYSADATDDNGSCTYPPHPNFGCDGQCLNDADGDGICDELEGLIPEAQTHCGIGTMWDAELGQCVFNVECAGDINLDGAITSGDILLMLANFGTYCPGNGPIDAGE